MWIGISLRDFMGSRASREAASLYDHPKGLSKRAAARGEPREGARYIYILGKYIACLAVPTYGRRLLIYFAGFLMVQSQPLERVRLIFSRVRDGDLRAGSRGFMSSVLWWIFFLSSLFIPTKPIFQCIIQSLITCDFSVFLAYLGRFRADLSDIFSGKLQVKVSEVLVGSDFSFGISGLRNPGIQFRNSGKSGIWPFFGCILGVFGVSRAFPGRSG